VLADVGWDRGFDEVDLLWAEVDPGACDPEVWAVVAQGTPEYFGVEGHGLIDIGDIERDVMDRQWLHEQKSRPPGIGVHARWEQSESGPAISHPGRSGCKAQFIATRLIASRPKPGREGEGSAEVRALMGEIFDGVPKFDDLAIVEEMTP
jgi:hypothetical protein